MAFYGKAKQGARDLVTHRSVSGNVTADRKMPGVTRVRTADGDTAHVVTSDLKGSRRAKKEIRKNQVRGRTSGR